MMDIGEELYAEICGVLAAHVKAKTLPWLANELLGVMALRMQDSYYEGQRDEREATDEVDTF